MNLFRGIRKKTDALKYKRAALKQGYSVKIIKGGSHDETGTNRV